MTDQPAPPPERKPRIVIEFTGPGASDCTIAPSPDVSASQLYGAAWLMESWAREVRAGQAAGSIRELTAAIPPDLLAKLGLGGRSS